MLDLRCSGRSGLSAAIIVACACSADPGNQSFRAPDSALAPGDGGEGLDGGGMATDESGPVDFDSGVDPGGPCGDDE